MSLPTTFIRCNRSRQDPYYVIQKLNTRTGIWTTYSTVYVTKIDVLNAYGVYINYNSGKNHNTEYRVIKVDRTILVTTDKLQDKDKRSHIKQNANNSLVLNHRQHPDYHCDNNKDQIVPLPDKFKNLLLNKALLSKNKDRYDKLHKYNLLNLAYNQYIIPPEDGL